ncbi:sulfite exporter TauE/SafE family protein [Serratia microhaemolytica]|uniref:sulfite exporter TauE/SafE family protein n=1 Tax=Serratia microhaemolytica TaxID=2675110 RepID=UPI000FDEDDC0|nr:sulfite exporter TauE/SafE family protein [Serratia microhaemolytica]
MVIALLLAVVIGMLLGITGAGGAILALPTLMFCLGWSPQQAAPVALLAVASGATLGVIEAWRRALVRYRAALVMVLAGLPMVAFGSWLAQRTSVLLLTLLFALAMLLAAWRLLSSPETTVNQRYPLRLDQQRQRFVWSGTTWLLFLSFGAFSGLMTGLLAVGGGFILVPLLRQFSPLSINSCIATSLMVVALLSSSAIVTALLQGAELPLPFTLWFVLSVLTGMWCGRQLNQRLSETRVQTGFAWLLILVALGMVVDVVLVD